MYMHAEKSKTHVKDLQSMSLLGGLWEHQNNPACTNCVRVFKLLKLDAARKKHCYFPRLSTETGCLGTCVEWVTCGWGWRKDDGIL